jgi:hypothetical protein
MIKTFGEAADPPGLQIILAKNATCAKPAFAYEGAAVRQQNTSITVAYSRPGDNPPLSANILSAPM